MVAYLCCELTARDLDSRLLIAAHLLRARMPVVVGQIWSFLGNREIGPKGVCLFATANRYQAKGMAMCKTAGHTILAVDEEALALRDEKLLVANVYPEALKQLDMFLFQDQRHETLLRGAFPDIRGRITGNARMEMLQQHRHIYGKEAAKFRDEGRYILVNTNLAVVNSAWGNLERAAEVMISASDLPLDEARRAVLTSIEVEDANRETILRLVAWMAERLADYRIVVRPHPAENADTWKSIPGIELVVGSNALPWMLGADLVVHTGSTTGLEAVLLGVPCLNVGQPDKRLILDQVNCSISSLEAAKEAIVAFVDNKESPITAFRSPIDSYPRQGAKAIADAILEFSGMEAPRITTWGAMPRMAEQIRKFSVTQAEFLGKVAAICSPLVPERLDVTPLDDSIFYITTTH